MWFEDQLCENQQFLYNNYCYSNDVFLTYTNNTTFNQHCMYDPNLYTAYDQETRPLTYRTKYILNIVDPRTNMPVNLYQNDICIQTDEVNKTLDRTEVKTINNRHNIETQTNDPPKYTTLSTQTLRITKSCYTQTVGAAVSSHISTTAKREALHKHSKFQGI